MGRNNSEKGSNNIVFINQDSGYLMIDIINAYTEAGHSCTLLTGRLVERSTLLHESVKIDRIIRYNRKNNLNRLFTWIYGFIQIWLKVIFHHRNAELFIVSNPPLAPLIPFFCLNKYSLLIYDIYIEKPSEFLPLKRYSPVSILWIYLHKRVLTRAEKIFTLTNGMKNIIEKYSNGKKAHVITIWTDNGFLKPIPSIENHFILSNKLNEKFIVLYSGSIGYSSDLDILLNVAHRIPENDIMFIIIGDGTAKPSIQRKAQELGLKNCKFFPWQDTGIFPHSLASANIAVVTLPLQAGRMAIPSKVFNYMSVGAPILCIAGHDSDLAKMIRETDIGRNFEPDQSGEIRDFILELFHNKSKHKYYSDKSLYTSTLFTKENAGKFLS